MDLGVAEAELLLNTKYGMVPMVKEPIRRSASVDIDQGHRQVCMRKRKIGTVHHDIYFAIHEMVA
jgi:hypothetical protein